MAERSLPDPLSGDEIVIDCCEQIAESLRRDSRLKPHMAYERYGAKVTVELWAEDLGSREEVSREVRIGPQPPEGQEVTTVQATIEPAPPNEVRVRSGQPIPTLTKDGTGRAVVKGVRYARREGQPANSRKRS